MKADIAVSVLKGRYHVTESVWHIHKCNFIQQFFSMFFIWGKHASENQSAFYMDTQL